MIAIAIPTLSGSGERSLAEGQAARLDHMAATLAAEIGRWSEHWPSDPVAVQVRAEVVGRIARWRAESVIWRRAVENFDEAGGDQLPEQLRETRR